MNIQRVSSIVLSLIIFLSFTHCNLPSPAAPSWDVALTIPLINKKYAISDFLDSTTELTVDENGTVGFRYIADLDTFTAADKLKLTALSQSASQSVGTFPIPSPGEQQVAVTLLDIYPDAAALDGTTVPVAAFSFDVPGIAVPAFEAFEWIEIQSGYIDLTLVNNLPIPLGQPMSIALHDAIVDTVIASATFSRQLATGEQETVRLVLDGKRVSSSLALRVAGSSPGSSTPVLIRTTDSFLVKVLISDLDLNAAAAQIERQTITRSDSLAISDSLFIEEARISRGGVFIGISGQIPVRTQLKLRLPDFVSPQGRALSDSLILERRASGTMNLDLSGYTFRPATGADGSQQVRLDWELQTLQDPQAITELRSTDNLGITFQLNELFFSEIRGRLQQQRVDITPQSFALKVPAELDSIQFISAELEVVLKNGINFPAATDIVIRGRNGRGQEVSVPVRSQILAARSDGTPVETRILLNGDNSAIVDLLNILPEQLDVFGSVTFGDASTSGSIRATDQVSGSVTFSAPVSFQLPEQDYDSPITEIRPSADAQKQIEQALQNGRLHATINSHLPLGATLSLLFARSRSDVFSAPGVTIGPVTVASGQVDPATGQVQGAVLSTISISMDKNELDFFAQDTIYGGLRVRFPGTGGRTVTALSTDYIDVQAYIGATTRVGQDSTVQK